jgi:hypothetical protein
MGRFISGSSLYAARIEPDGEIGGFASRLLACGAPRLDLVIQMAGPPAPSGGLRQDKVPLCGAGRLRDTAKS